LKNISQLANIRYSGFVQDEFRYNGLIPSRNLEDTTPFLEDIDRTGFLSFIRDMLTWLPEERKTAREMTNHPFLKLSA
jgi:hypothetical protein